VTDPRIFVRPSTLAEVFAFVGELERRPIARLVGPGPAHLEVFRRLCEADDAAGRLVADARHEAVAIEHGCTLVSTDADFDRFPGLRWRHSLRP